MTDTFKIQKLDEKWEVTRKTGQEEIGKIGFYSLGSAFKFMKACTLPDVEEEVCEMCKGTGWVITMGYVYAGEPHMADIDERRCDCQLNNFEE